MGYAILRAKKLKSVGAVSRSAKHTFRERPTPNADPARTGANRSTGAKSSAEVLGKLAKALPAKRRKDAVLAIEYLVTASPEVWKRHGGALNDLGDGLFADALRWLQERHGKENVLCTAVHLDETTPHLVAYVVPKTKDGRLSCRDFLGGPKMLEEMQDSFHAACGAKRGLERGVKRSKAKHQDVGAFYTALAQEGQVEQLTPKDYAAKAVGIETEAWRKASERAVATQKAARVSKRMGKGHRSRKRALEAQEAQLQEKGFALDGRARRLNNLEADLQDRSKRLDRREAEVRQAEGLVINAEAENARLRRVLGEDKVKETAPHQRRSNDGPKAPGD
ncbi:MobV family relaxase [Pseudomonas aeruginosa]